MTGLTEFEIEQMIQDLDAMADKLFGAEQNFLGNQVQEIAYLLSANVDEAAEEDGQPDEMQEWESFDPDC